MEKPSRREVMQTKCHRVLTPRESSCAIGWMGYLENPNSGIVCKESSQVLTGMSPGECYRWLHQERVFGAWGSRRNGGMLLAELMGAEILPLEERRPLLR